MKYFFLLMLISCTNFRYKNSDHYSEKTDKFFNSTENIEKSFVDLFKWKFTSEKSEWPSSVPLTAKPKMLDSIATDQANINFINHSTFLIQIEKVNILTDPVFSKRVSPVSFAGPKRVHPPGIDIEKLPKIDVAFKKDELVITLFFFCVILEVYEFVKIKVRKP